MEKNRYYQIDLLRFIAALMVVFFHYAFRGFAGAEYTSVEYPIVSIVARYGYLGVDLFFIISGFVILRSAQGRTPSAFVISRATRLYPAYWFAVTLTFLLITFFAKGLFDSSFTQYLVNLTECLKSRLHSGAAAARRTTVPASSFRRRTARS